MSSTTREQRETQRLESKCMRIVQDIRLYSEDFGLRNKKSSQVLMRARKSILGVMESSVGRRILIDRRNELPIGLAKANLAYLTAQWDPVGSLDIIRAHCVHEDERIVFTATMMFGELTGNFELWEKAGEAAFDRERAQIVES